jgi:hypothetical protein
LRKFRLPSLASSEVPPLVDADVIAELKRILPYAPTIEQELSLLLQRYGAAAVRQALSKLTRGRPANQIDDLFQVWFAVEVFRRRNPGTPVTKVCDNLAKKGGIRKQIVEHGKYKQTKIAVVSGTIRRKHTKAKSLLANDRMLRHAWQCLLEDSCGGVRPQLEIPEGFEILAKSWAKT